jgi:hypothetical protein
MNFIIKLLKFKNLTTEVKYNLILIITKKIIKYNYFILCNKIITAFKLVYLIMRNIIINHKLFKE